MKLGAGSVRPEAGGDRALTGRLAAITGARLLFLTLLLGATAFFYLRGDLAIYPQSLRIIFVTIAGAYALGAVYAVLLRAGAPPRQLAYTQILLDQLTWTAIVYVTGGATSGATSFYALTCLLGAMLIGLRGATVGAVSGVALYTSLCFAFVFHWIKPPVDQSSTYLLASTSDLVYPLLLNTLGIGVVALLAGYLAERLRLTGGALEAATRRALEAERLALLGSVAAGLAHEIRNPLGSISGSIEMLRESPYLSDEDKQLCAIVQREAARLNHLVSDMLDLSRPRQPHIEPVDVAALASDVVALAARTDRSGAGDVNVVYDGPTIATYARCDGGQMRQVLWNLVRNAVQASGAGKEVRVVLRAGTLEMGVDLRVEDQGPGIPELAREKIFDAFFTTRAGGAGMGLAVVKRIIDDHAHSGAHISVTSSALGGATFSVHLAGAVARSSLVPRAE
jgi:two-component system sensor histidine kinase HydH